MNLFSSFLHLQLMNEYFYIYKNSRTLGKQKEYFCTGMIKRSITQPKVGNGIFMYFSLKSRREQDPIWIRTQRANPPCVGCSRFLTFNLDRFSHYGYFWRNCLKFSMKIAENYGKLAYLLKFSRIMDQKCANQKTGPWPKN